MQRVSKLLSVRISDCIPSFAHDSNPDARGMQQIAEVPLQTYGPAYPASQTLFSNCYLSIRPITMTLRLKVSWTHHFFLLNIRAKIKSKGIRRVLSHYRGEEIPRGVPLPKDDLESVRMGTTVATNALLERKGTKHTFLVTKGFRDLLEIGYQSRPRLFDLSIVKPEVLYSHVREIDERVTIEGFDEDQEGRFKTEEEIPGELVMGSSGDMIRILKPLDESRVRQMLKDLRAEGVDTLAVCFTHSHIFPHHETRVKDLALEEGFTHVSLSSSVAANMIKMVPRGSSASADAYLTPEIKKYVRGFAKGFRDGNLDDVRCEFMQSDGGLVNHDNFSGLRGILSGPAGALATFPSVFSADAYTQQEASSDTLARVTTKKIKCQSSALTWAARRPTCRDSVAILNMYSRAQPPESPFRVLSST